MHSTGFLSTNVTAVLRVLIIRHGLGGFLWIFRLHSPLNPGHADGPKPSEMEAFHFTEKFNSDSNDGGARSVVISGVLLYGRQIDGV